VRIENWPGACAPRREVGAVSMLSNTLQLRHFSGFVGACAARFREPGRRSVRFEV